MIILISPSKTQICDTDFSDRAGVTSPQLLEETTLLAREMKQYSAADISALMNISDKLGELNYKRFRQWQLPFTPQNSSPAIFTFRGDVYDGLDAASLDESALEFAQAHLRILSGFYGLLRPLDLIQPYRLEMKTALKNPRGKDLYAFWGEIISNAINEACKKSGSEYVINLASGEYFKAVKAGLLRAKVITPVFKDYRGGSYKVIGLFAKRARGKMARHIIDRQIVSPENLTSYNEDGYAFAQDMSDESTLTFIRDNSG